MKKDQISILRIIIDVRSALAGGVTQLTEATVSAGLPLLDLP
jgi:hypothetical protein